jgi:diacylglycerol kinase (ATP)
VLSIDGGAQSVQDRYLLLASTLERLPLGVKPFGRARSGMKMLAIDAFPSNVLLSSIALLAGSEAAWLDRAGFHRCDPQSVDMDLDGDFILDGERFQAGRITLSSGDPIRFAVP